jgi:hypothetical protein
VVFQTIFSIAYVDGDIVLFLTINSMAHFYCELLLFCLFCASSAVFFFILLLEIFYEKLFHEKSVLLCETQVHACCCRSFYCGNVLRCSGTE